MTNIEQHPTGDIITDITFDEYWRVYAEQGYEWVGEGMVEMAAVHERHDNVVYYLRNVLTVYMEARSIGVIRGEHVAMRFEFEGTTRTRLPDVKVVLDPTEGRLTPTAIVGPADIVIEVVSLESQARDYGEKFIEYETIGVQEYWIIDTQLRRADFNQLDSDGMYQRAKPDDNGNYWSPLLPDLPIHVPTLWQQPLPTIREIVKMVDTFLGES